jgi:hypothetical protein
MFYLLLNLKSALYERFDGQSPRSAGWSWRLELELCERKTLLPGWWLEAEAGVV